MTRYLSSTAHPWACLLFLLPLLVGYEIGVEKAGDPTVRNGADVWVRWGLERYGLTNPWAAPGLVAGLFLVRSWADWKGRPKPVAPTLFGMVVESVLFAVVLWTAARNFEPLARQWGVLPLNAVQFRPAAAGEVVRYVGAGVYEEVLFRLGLFGLSCFLLRLVLMPKILAIGLAAAFSALVFAAAHHVGTGAEPVKPEVVLFRVAAGLYFTLLYVTRGFGIAVGAHAGYDILAGVSVG